MLYFYQDYGNSKRIVQDEQQWKTSIEATIKGVEEIAAKSGLPEVVEMANFFKACKFRAIPMAHNSGEIFFGFGEKIPDTRHKIGVTFLSKKDEKLGEAWKEILKSNGYAFLYVKSEREDLSFLALRENAPISKTWRSLLLLHEISHIYLYAAKTYERVKDSEIKNARLELETYSIQDKILRALGGKKYEAILEKEIARIEKEFAEQKEIIAPRYDLYGDELAEIFGPSESEKESVMRATTVWIEAFLNFYDKKYKNEKEAFMKKMVFFIGINNNKRNLARDTKV